MLRPAAHPCYVIVGRVCVVFTQSGGGLRRRRGRGKVAGCGRSVSSRCSLWTSAGEERRCGAVERRDVLVSSLLLSSGSGRRRFGVLGIVDPDLDLFCLWIRMLLPFRLMSGWPDVLRRSCVASRCWDGWVPGRLGCLFRLRWDGDRIGWTHGDRRAERDGAPRRRFHASRTVWIWLAGRRRAACSLCSSLVGLCAVWTWALGPNSLYCFKFYCFLSFSGNGGYMPVISPCRVVAGRRGLGPGLHPLCAWSVLGRQRVPCVCKWSRSSSGSNVSALARRRVPCVCKWLLPPSGRVKLRVVGVLSRRQHNRKVVPMAFMLRSHRVLFLLCHRNVKANGEASSALFANWCLFEYMFFVEFPDIISGRTLYAYCNQGFRLNVPPLYSTVSLMKA
ncbi:hypothetical protein RchiOBHm_Chr3g0465101 [Rosa chinensis]|uniref:Uncharacterized protein n=1 Tax=Rosa chinensis TaxID=74649 RepID=A0A2P6R9M4_ROSCH|nr:hypothetical protein RchiOBHm_Chr3g0465101 [Rosa chinensis]